MKKALLTLALLALAAPAFAQLDVVQRIRREYPTPLGATHGKFLVEVACQTNKGLLRKDGGTHITLADGTNVAQDIVMDRDGVHYDILGDGENLAIPAWNQVTEPAKVDPARYYAPVCNNTPPAPPATTPATPPDWLQDLAAGLALLESELKAVRAELAELKARPVPEYSATLPLRLGTLTLRPVK
jgi:hypothetical protein